MILEAYLKDCYSQTCISV